MYGTGCVHTLSAETTSGRPSPLRSPAARLIGTAPAAYPSGALNGTAACAEPAVASTAIVASIVNRAMRPPFAGRGRASVNPRTDPTSATHGRPTPRPAWIL